VIATGLVAELVACALVVVGLLLGPSGTEVLWASIAVVLVGLVIVGAGVRRARPPWQGWTPSATPPPDAGA
jgi:hypothetical protein